MKGFRVKYRQCIARARAHTHTHTYMYTYEQYIFLYIWCMRMYNFLDFNDYNILC
jgi:hypothetical protein